MAFDKVWAVYFSPCGRTKQVAEHFANEMARQLQLPLSVIDYTLPEARQTTHIFDEGDLVIWATPVYAGRVPNKLLPFVQNHLQGHQASVVPLAVFGNRSYDDALSEMLLISEQNDFKVLAAGAIVAEHAFATALGASRPDSTDLEFINNFAKQLTHRIESGQLKRPQVKGAPIPSSYYTPRGILGETTVFLKAKPITDASQCTKCGICATYCPMGVISKTNFSEVVGSCIKCQSCIKRCPVGAKAFEDEAFLSHKAMLLNTYVERVACEVFID